MAIDVDSPFERLQKHKPTAGVPFYSLKKPEGKNQYGYRIRFLEDIKIVMNTRYPYPDGSPKPELVGQVEFDEVWNDKEVKKGDAKRLNLSRHASCDSWFKGNFEPIRSDDGKNIIGYKAEGKKVDLMIQGQVQGKKNKYWAYAILLAEDELDLVSVSMLALEFEE